MRDQSFGPLVMVGLGGVLVEVFKDTAIRVAPVTESGAGAMLAEPARRPALARLSWVATGRYRCDRVADRAAVGLGARRAEIEEMDLNPVIVYPRRQP